MNKRVDNKRPVRRIIVVLPALLLAAMAMVSLASAGNSVSKDKQTDNSVHYLLPSDYLDDWKEASPIPESEIYSVIIPESSISKKGGPEGIYHLDFSLLDAEISDSFIKSSEVPGKLVAEKIDKNNPVVMFQIPKTMYDYFVKNSKNGEIAFPQQLFKRYNSMDELILESRSVTTKKADYIDHSKSAISPPAMLFNISEYSPKFNPNFNSNQLGWHNEWITFTQRDSSVKPTYITGKITPNLFYLDSNDRFEIYQERELYMDESRDAIELVVTFHDKNDGANMLLFPVIWDNSVLTDFNDWDYSDGYVKISLSTLPDEYEYYTGLGVGAANAGIYEIWFHDVSGKQWYYYRYLDRDNPGYYFNRLTGSSEFLWKKKTGGTYVARTIPVKDEWNYDGSYWYYPRQVWQYDGEPDNEDYVHIDWSWYPYPNGNQLVTKSYFDSRW